MKNVRKYIVGGLVVLGLLGSTAATWAAYSDGDRCRRGAGGEITAISEDSVTVVGRNDEARTINISDETVITFVETQSEGSLDELEFGDKIRARGSRNDDGTVDAAQIHVAPDGEQVGGRVSAVDGSTITVENRDGEATTINTNDDTQFRNRDASASLADVAEGQHLKAFGTLDDDGSLSADIVFLKEGRGGDRGEGEGRRGGPGRGSERGGDDN